MIENSCDDLSDCESLLRPVPDLHPVGRGDDRSWDRLLASRPDVVLIADDEVLEKTVWRLHRLLALGQDRILVVGRRTADPEIMQLLEAGANGYLQTRMLAHQLARAVTCLFAGEAWISRKMTGLLLERLRTRNECRKATRRRGRAAPT